MGRKHLVATLFGGAAIFLASTVDSVIPAGPAAAIASVPSTVSEPELAAHVEDVAGQRPPSSLLDEFGPPPPPPPPTPAQALRRGVLVVVSIPTQQAFVFKRGELWDTTKVSTGKPGHDTPRGVFPILQKKVEHRSTLYDDASMPYMQRLTWGGVALHAGRVPGFAASHGCIRLPKDFARKLYGITNFSSTVVVVTDRKLATAKQARSVV